MFAVSISDEFKPFHPWRFCSLWLCAVSASSLTALTASAAMIAFFSGQARFAMPIIFIHSPYHKLSMFVTQFQTRSFTEQESQAAKSEEICSTKKMQIKQ